MSRNQKIPHAVLTEEEIWAVAFSHLITEDPVWYEKCIMQLVGSLMIASKGRLSPTRIETRLKEILKDKGIPSE